MSKTLQRLVNPAAGVLFSGARACAWKARPLHQQSCWSLPLSAPSGLVFALSHVLGLASPPSARRSSLASPPTPPFLTQDLCTAKPHYYIVISYYNQYNNDYTTLRRPAMTDKFTTQGFADYILETRGAYNTFLDKINSIIDWRNIEKALRKKYTKKASADGRPAYLPFQCSSSCYCKDGMD